MSGEYDEPYGAPPDPSEGAVDFYRNLFEFTPRILVTRGIVIVNIAMFVIMTISGVDFFKPTADSVLSWGANYGPQTLNGQWWRLATCMFLHFGILHVGFNMWVLTDLGRLVERLVGNVGFAVLYVVSGVAASLASLAWNPTVVSAGASGAVFGVAGALFGLAVFRGNVVPPIVLMPLRKSVGMFLLYNVIYGLAATGIDVAAHVGGLVAGFLCGLVLCQPLTAASVAGRGRRNLITLAVGSVALVAASFAMPAAPLDPIREVRRFAAEEKRCMNVFNDLVRQRNEGSIDDEAFADNVEKSVLEPWTKLRQSLDLLAQQRHVNRTNIGRIAKYAELRESGWQLMVDGIRHSDRAKLEQSSAQMQAAEEAARQADGPS